MSLTSHLADLASPVRQYLERVAPELGEVTEFQGVERLRAREWGFQRILDAPLLVPRLVQVDGSRAGTAIDLRTRIALGGFDPRRSTAQAGIASLPTITHQIENGEHRARVLEESFEVAVELVNSSSSEDDLDRAALLLATCEQLFRGGPQVMNGSVGRAFDAALGGVDLAERLAPLELADIRSMMLGGQPQLESWREAIARGAQYVPGPSFSGSSLVGGADGDWILDGILIDCKAYEKLSSPTLREFLLQMLGYVLLDLDDEFGIREVGLWLPRQGLLQTWPVARLIGGDPDELLPELRAGFAEAARAKRSVRHYPDATAERKRLLLAENPYTPFETLEDLAGHDDERIRRRVARNTSTPEHVLHLLARDQRPYAREGVAMNPETPVDLIAILLKDRIASVRKAAARHPLAREVAIRAQPSELARRARELEGESAPEGSPTDFPCTAQTELAVPGRGPSPVELQRARPANTNAFWLSGFLWLLQHDGGSYRQEIPVRAETRWWAMVLKRDLRLPTWLQTDMPDKVIDDLFALTQPGWLRVRAAAWKTVNTAESCLNLLEDPVAQIRVDALQRSQEQHFAELGPLLTELATSPPARRTFVQGARKNSYQDLRAADICEPVIWHNSTPVEALEQLAETGTVAVRQQLAVQPRLSVERRVTLARQLLAKNSLSFRKLLASSLGTPQLLLAELASDVHPAVRALLAVNSAVPVEILRRLARDDASEVQHAALQNPDLPIPLARGIVEQLFTEREHGLLCWLLQLTRQRPELSPDLEVVHVALDSVARSRAVHPDGKALAASDSRSSIASLTWLSRQVEGDHRRLIAQNPSVSVELLNALSRDPDDRVRTAVAATHRVDEATLLRLAQDKKDNVRAAVASDPRLTELSLNALLRDQSWSVRTAAAKNSSVKPEQLVISTELAERRAALAPIADDQAHRRQLVAMAASTRAQTRIQAAYGDQVDVLTLLAGDQKSFKVRLVVAGNPDTDPAVMMQLANDKNDEVRQALALNPAATTEVLLNLAAQGADLAVLVALNPDAPTDALEVLAGDHEPLIEFVAGQALRARTQ